VIQQHVQAPPPPMSRFRPGVPDRLEGVVQRALAKNPEERYQSAEEMQAALRDARGVDSAPRPRGGSSSPPDRRLVLVLGAVAVLAIISLVLVLLLR